MKENYSNKKTKKGFTFIEVIVTMFVLVGVMTAVTGIFSSSTKSYRKAALTQQDLEQAQFAMNLMAKVLRTSFVTVPSTNDIIAYDKSQDKCVRFQFDATGNKLKMASVSMSSYTKEKDKIQNCHSTTSGIASLQEVTSTHVDAGSFDVTPTVVVDDEVTLFGKVTISMSICPANGCDDASKVRLQSTVSQRIYKEIAP